MKSIRNCGLIGALLTALALGQAQAQTLNIYNAAGFSSYYAEQLVPLFEAKTGIDVELVSIGDDEIVDAVSAQVHSDRSDIHLVIAGEGLIAQLADERLLQPYSEFHVPNLALLNGSPAEVYLDRWERLAIPSHADYTPVGLFASSVDPASVNTLDRLKNFICANKGRWQEGAGGRSGPGNGHKLAVAAALGEDLEDPDSWSAAWDYMGEYANCVREFTNGTGATIKALAAGENLGIPMNYGWQAELRHKGEIPADSHLVNPYGITFVDPHGMAIVDNIDGNSFEFALMFLDFQLSNEAQALITNTFHFPLTLSGWEVSDPDMKDATTKAVFGISFGQFVADGDFSAVPSGKAQNRAFELWDEKIGAVHKYVE